MEAKDKIGGVIPVIGLGTWNITGDACVETVRHAIEIGYRHIDTAQMYGNEKEVGKGIKTSRLSREELFVTTKISVNNLHPDLIGRSTDTSLQKLDTGYIDLLLIHWPTSNMDLESCLKVMFQLKEEGKVKYVGVSNFNAGLFQQAIDLGPVVNNQVEFTPYKPQKDNLEVAKENNLSLTAYSPLGKGSIAKEKELDKIAGEYGKTPSQIALRWLIQLRNVSVIPKASQAKHREENIDIFDFALREEHMQEIGK